MSRDTSTLRYLRPAETWTEALPIGNGRLGGMVHAGPLEDLIALNEETLWGRSPQNPNRPHASEALAKARSLIFDGRLLEAEQVARDGMLADPDQFPPYEPLGDLRITSIRPVDYTDYVRELDLTTAIAGARFTLDGTVQRREYFSSAVDDVIAIRYTSEGRLPRMKFELGRGDGPRVRVAGSPPAMPGQAGAQVSVISMDPGADPLDHILLMTGTIGGGGVDFAAGVSVRVEDGGLLLQHHWDERAPHVLYSTGGVQVTMLIAAESTFRGGGLADASRRVIDRLVAAEQKGFERVRADHVSEHRALYERFSLSLRNEEERREEPRPVPELLAKAASGDTDVRELVELFVNHCRYLLLSSSRPGGLPSNLQGVWNAARWPNWESDFHPNVNLQLNYWAADATGLPETVEPLLDWIESTLESGRTTARATYDAGGWVMNHISNAWGFTSPGAGVFGIWPLGGAWIVMNVYDHYLYTLDLSMLRDRLYPIMRESAEFLLDFLVEGPPGTAAEGYLVTAPSNSPENYFVVSEGVQATMTYGATMDIQIIDHLFGAVLDALTTLRRDDPALDTEFDTGFGQRVESARARLLPVKVSPSTQGVQEWAEDYVEADPGHRHVSALYGVFPARSITPTATPELARAAAHTIDRKFAAGYQAEGWSLGLISAIRARLGDGDGALYAITWVLRELLFQNLFVEAHMYPQVGDMQGIPTGVLEMLVDSDLGRIVLLPALPTAWPDGHVEGVRLRGGHQLDMRWRSGRLVEASIVLNAGGPVPEIRVGVTGEYVVAQEADAVSVTAKV